MNGELAKLAEDLSGAGRGIGKAADRVVHEAAGSLETRLRRSGDLASGVVTTFPAPRTAVVGSTKRFGVYAETGASPIEITGADVARAADELAAGLQAAAATLSGGGP